MNKNIEGYTKMLDEKSNRNIDALIDGAIETMQRKKRRKRVFGSLSTVMASFALYVIVINTSVTAQAFVLQNDILKTVSKPLIFNDIFEEVKTEVYEDELISIEFVLNNIENIQVTKSEVSKQNPGDGLTQMKYVDNSENDRYYIEYDPDFVGMDERIKAIWESTNQGMKKIYTYHDEVYSRTPIVVVDGVLYVIDNYDTEIDRENYYDVAQNVYAISGNNRTMLLEGKKTSAFHQFFVSNGTVYFMYLRDMNTDPKWEIVNLDTKEVKVLDVELIATDYFTNISVYNNTFMLSKLDTKNTSTCNNSAPLKFVVVKPDGSIIERSGCASRNYKLISDSIIFGQDLGNGAENGGQYQVINLETNDTYTGNNTTEAYNRISSTKSMIAVMRVNTKDGVKELFVTSDLSDNYSYKEISQDPQELLLTGDYHRITLTVKTPWSDTQTIYTISKK